MRSRKPSPVPRSKTGSHGARPLSSKAKTLSTASRKQRALLDANAPREQRGVEHGEDDRDLDGAEGQWQNGDFGADHDIVGMTEEAVRAAPHERLARYRDDTRGPVRTEACDGPDSQRL